MRLAVALAALVGLAACAPAVEDPGWRVRAEPSTARWGADGCQGTACSLPLPTPSRASRSRPREVQPAPAGYAAWRTSSKLWRVVQCESRWDPTARSRTGKYRGLLQMDADFWRTYGGLRYASTPDQATVEQQLRVGYRGWLARGWQPWTCG